MQSYRHADLTLVLRIAALAWCVSVTEFATNVFQLLSRLLSYCTWSVFASFTMVLFLMVLTVWCYVRHLGFLKVGNFDCLCPLDGQYASPSQISCRSVKPLQRYGRFSIFQDGGRPLSWICYTPVWTTHEEYLVFITVQNLVWIGAVVSIMCKL